MYDYALKKITTLIFLFVDNLFICFSQQTTNTMTQIEKQERTFFQTIVIVIGQVDVTHNICIYKTFLSLLIVKQNVKTFFSSFKCKNEKN